jgi:L-seryl-tRNA(Ser) seleniumtransferase
VNADQRERLRTLPSVDRLVREAFRAAAGGEASRPIPERGAAVAELPRSRVTAAARELLDAERRRVLDGSAPPADAEVLGRRLAATLARGAYHLRPVINATGVVLHTNLGRALLSGRALARLAVIGAGYSNLELDLADKSRGSRYSHVQGQLRRLTGAEDGLVVNNNAAAVLLALETLARGREVIVSRGELIEIGGEFRIPDIMARSGAVLREVGATNRTHLRDYADAITPATALLMKVHSSNYRVVGFTAEVTSRELVELGRARGVPVMEDLGSGSLIDFRRFGFPPEPTVQEVVGAGVDLVSFSGDKLLGGPQAGIVVGRKELVSRLQKNPLNRALRIDKLTIAALEATLHAYEADDVDSVPTVRMLTEPVTAIRRRASAVMRGLPAAQRAKLGAALQPDQAQVGGGALPTVELPTVAIAIGTADLTAEALDEALRAGDPPVVGRIKDDRLLLDVRTVLPEQTTVLARILAAL